MFSLPLSPLDGFIVLQKMMKSCVKNERGCAAEKRDIKDAGGSICGPSLDENGADVTVPDVQTAMWRK